MTGRWRIVGSLKVLHVFLFMLGIPFSVILKSTRVINSRSNRIEYLQDQEPNQSVLDVCFERFCDKFDESSEIGAAFTFNMCPGSCINMYRSFINLRCIARNE